MDKIIKNCIELTRKTIKTYKNHSDKKTDKIIKKYDNKNSLAMLIELEEYVVELNDIDFKNYAENNYVLDIDIDWQKLEVTL
jgi:isopropylmalate/homocitrate/citramalate synthase